MNRPKVESEALDLYPNDKHNQYQKKGNKSQLRNLRGKTLEIYYYLVSEKREHGVREIQRYFAYSSPSIASYHLNRLLESGLVEKSKAGNYFVDGDPVKLGELKDHVAFAGLFIPRILLYGVQVVISLLITILLYLTKSNIQIWFWYFMIVNSIMLGFIVRDSFKISNNLKLSSAETQD